MLLGVLAFDFGQYMRDDALAAANLAEETRGYYLAVAAMNRAIYDQKIAEALGNKQNEPIPNDELEDRPPLIPVDGQWHPLELLGAQAEVRVTDEGSGIPLALPLDPTEDEGAVGNGAALEVFLGEVIKNLIRGGNRTTGVNVKEEKAYSEITNAILDWIDPDDEVRKPGGAEAKYYESLDPPRTPKNGPLDSPEELLLVKGVDPDLFYGSPGRPGLRDFISVFNPSASIKLRHATADFLAVLFGLDHDEAEEVVALRSQTPDGWEAYIQRLQGLAGTVGKGMMVSPSGVLHVAAAGEDDDLADGGGGEGFEPEQDTALILVEGRADTSAPRNQSRVAAVVQLAEPANCELSFCREQVTDGITMLRWFDRGPWSYDEMQPAPAAEDPGA
jgi:type II secretion system (T2SS) protein K